MREIPFKLESNLGYGAWLLPSGNVIEATDGFDDTHADIVCEYFDLNRDNGFQYEVAYAHGWVRLIYPTIKDGSICDLGVDVYCKALTREQIRVITSLADYAFGKETLVYFYTNHPNVVNGCYMDPKMFFRELKKCQIQIPSPELTQTRI